MKDYYLINNKNKKSREVFCKEEFLKCEREQDENTKQQTYFKSKQLFLLNISIA